MDQLSLAHRDEIIEGLAQKVQGWGLSPLAIFLLESHKPLAFVGSQLLLFAQPLLGILVADTLVRDAAALLAEPRSVERLIARLEEQARRSPVTSHQPGVSSSQSAVGRQQSVGGG